MRDIPLGTFKAARDITQKNGLIGEKRLIDGKFSGLVYRAHDLITLKRKHSRLEREGNTVAVMISFYCRKHHSRNEMCPECSTLLEYARQRLDRCPLQEGKTTCGKCPVHCYKPEMRNKIRAIMRYSGPRMVYSHPILAFLHLIDGRRKIPVTGTNKNNIS